METGRTRRAGAVAVEFAIAFSALLVFFFAIFEYGRFLMMRHLVVNAAREGARQAIVNTGTSPVPDIQQTTFNYLAGQSLLNNAGNPLTKADIQVYRADPATGLAMTDSKGSTWTNAGFGEGIAVKITAKYQPMLPSFGMLPNPVPINFTCVMRSEAN